ncbi:E3 ubiquitin-protein ligase ptr1 [Yarrowia sp. B02]|nr:E3 ubiquitin-protein ligase ptr1 [Yarrowia sp. B02]
MRTLTPTQVARLDVQTTPDLRHFINQVTSCDEAELPLLLDTFREKGWERPKGNLYLWYRVLERFEKIMEACVGSQTDIIEVSEAQEQVLVSILLFSAFLLEYCSNRSLYSSTKLLSSLLSCSSLAVLNATLSVCIQISQRYSDTRGGRAATAAIDIHKMLKIASLFAANIAPLQNSDKISLVDFVDDKKWPDQLRAVSIEYFASRVREPSTPTKARGDKKSGLQTFTISSSDMKKLSVMQAYERAVHVLPEDLHLDALMYIRAAKSFSTGAASRVPLVSAKCMAITFSVFLLTENVLATKFYAPYPNLVQHLVDLLNPDYKVPNELRSSAIEGLYAMARQRTKLHEILTCLSANVSHGLLMHIVRTLISDVRERKLDEKYASDFCGLVVNLCVSSSTGQMLVSAGLVPALLELIDNDSAYLHMKNVALTLLGQLTLSAPAAFTALINANGVDLIARLIKNEVDHDLEHHGPVPTHCKVDYEISYYRAGWLKTILKFVLQVMPTGGNAERLRNLIDSSTLLSSLGAILQSPHVFGSTIVSVSLGLIITVLHNEPTSYSIISEAGLIDIFFACADEIMSLASNDILMAGLNAIGAICLNPDGLERAASEFDYSLIFKVLEDPTRSEELSRHDLAAELGAMVDELIRHNPKLLPSVMEAVDKTAASLASGVSHNCTDTKKTDADDSERAFVIDNFGRFFDCLIANERVCDYFVKDNGFNYLLDIITLADMPYDYGTSEAVNSLNDGLKHLSQRDEDGLVEVYDKKFDSLLHNTESEFYKFWKSEPGWDTSKIPTCSPELLNQLTSVHSLLNSYELVFDWAAQLKFVESKNPVEIFELIESLYSRASWEIVRISNAVPEDWKRAARLHYFSIAFGPSRKLEEDKKKQIAEIEDKLPADSEYWDLKQYWFVLNGITMATLRCLSNVAKLISAKRLVDHTTNKKLALNIADWVAKGLINNFNYLGIILQSDLPLKARSGYCVYVIAALRETMLSSIRGGASGLSNSASLRTSVFAPFRQAGGLEKLLEVLHYFWGQMEDGDTPEEAAEAKKLSRDEFESREFKKPATLTVNRILEFLLSLVTKECIVDSSFTLTLNTGDERPYFDGGQFLVENKLAVLTGIKPLLEDKATQRRAGARVFEWLLQLVSRLTQRIGEPAASDPALIPTVLSPQFCTPSDYKVAFLEEQGVPDPKKKLIEAGDNLGKVLKAAGKDVELPEVPRLEVWVPHAEDGTPLLTVAQLNTLRANLGNSLQERSLEFLEKHADHASAVQELFSVPSDSLLEELTQGLEKGTPGRYELIALSVQDDRNREKFLKRGMYTLEWAEAYLKQNPDFLSRSEFVHFLAVYERCYFVATEYPLEEAKHLYAEVNHSFTDYSGMTVSEEAVEYVFSQLLAIESFASSDVLLAVSRVLALYTTKFKYSDRIRGSPVLSALLQGIKSFPDAAHMDSIQQTVLVLLRHCTETPTSIQNIIAHKLGQSSRAPIANLMQQYSYLYARSPEYFILTAKRTLTCDLKHFPEVKPKKVDVLTAEVEHCGIMELLTSEITDLGSSWVPEASDNVENPAEPKDYPQLAYLTFLLNCMTELLGAYADSKLEFVSLGRKKHGLLSYFLTKLLYFSTAANEPDNTETRARMSVSASATSCLHALVSSTQERDFEADSTEKRDLVMVRKALLDTVMRLLREATHLDTLDKRYTRYAVLLDLCHKLLSAKTLSTATNNVAIASEYAQQDSAEFALVMYDKHFAKSVTALIADLDLNFPGAKKVAKTLLRPIHRLSHLTMENPDALERGEDESEDESDSEDDSEDESESESHQNIFQNSTLGMFEAEANSADEEMEIGSDQSELDDDDMEELEEPLYLDQEEGDSDLELDMSEDQSDHVAESDIEEVIAMEEEDDWESYSEEELGEEELEDELDFSEAEPAEQEGDAIGGVRDLIAALGNPSTPPPPPDYAIDLDSTDEEELQESNSLFVPPPGHSAVGGHPLLSRRQSSSYRSLGLGLNHPMDNLLERMVSRAVTGPDGGSFTIGIGTNSGVQIQRNVEALLTSVGGYRRPRKAGWDAKLLRFEASSTVIRWTAFARMFDIVKQRGVCWRAVAPIMNAIGPPVEAEIEARELAQREAMQGRLAQDSVIVESDEEMVSAEEVDVDVVSEDMMEEGVEDEEVEEVASVGTERDPVYVTIGGRQVDISGLDIDPTFLEALPEDMREEVVLQHIRESELDDSVISTLPDNMRAELRPVTLGQADSQDFATFLGTLDSNLRQTILMEQDEATLNALPDELVAEARRLRVRQPLVMEDEDEGTEDDTAMIDDAVTSTLGVATTTPRRHSKKVDVFAARNFVDKSGITALIRLLYLPQGSASRDFLHELLLNVVRNRQARADVISILLSILQDGCRDRASLEKSFANLTSTSNVSGTPKSPIKAGLGSASSELSTDVTPMTVTLQVLDALSYLIRNNAHIRHYFLTEHEVPVGHRVRKKALKSMKYPVNILFGLLKNPVVTERSQAMEVLSSMLQEATRPLQAKRRASMNVAAAAAEAIRAEASVSTSSDIVVDESEPEVPRKKTLKDLSPYIPSGNLSLVTQILTANECSSLTFQQTLSCMQNLLHIDNAVKVFSSQLSSQAIRLGKTLITDLVNLNSLIHTRNALQGSALSKFSLASSDQAKLLRVLTAIDILFDKRSETKVHIYNSLTFGPLWGALSDVLGYVAEHPDLIHVATALLPLMEALMVVCKHSQVTERSADAKYSARSYDFANEPIENLFFSFTDEHRKILNLMVRNNPKLMSGSFSILVKNPKVLEFDNKRNYFNRKLHSSTQSEGATINLNVRRDQVFLDSYKSMYFKSASEIRSGKLNIHFSGEEGVDAGGVTREWYQVLARQMFNPDYALFTPVASDTTTFHPNRTSWVNPEHLSFFKFIGRIIGKAIFDQRLLDCHFSRAVYKKILGRGVSLKDMETLDIEYHKSLVWMLENDITDIITETMSIETEDYGEKKTIDLMPDGRNIAVDESNKSEFVQRVVEYRLITSVEEQLEHFLQGFHDIVPKELVSIFNEQELELLICGLPEIDVDDWRNNTVYTNYSASSPQIQWFWRSIRSFDDEERAKLLQFVTGTSKVPLDGFKELEGMNGPTKFNIHRAYGNNERLPSSHTCFNQLDLPEYDSYETLRGSLLLAITEGREGFGFA